MEHPQANAGRSRPSEAPAILEVDLDFRLQSASQACRTLLPELDPRDPSSAARVLEPLLRTLKRHQAESGASELQAIPIRFMTEEDGERQLPLARIETLRNESGQPRGHRITLAAPEGPGSRDLPRVPQDRTVSPEEWRQARLASLGALCGGVAHKLNNLLVSILGHAELLGLQNLDASDKDAVNQILHAGLKARDLCSDLLHLNSRSPANLATVNLWHLIHESAHLFKFSLPSGCRLELRAEVEEAFVRADPALLKRIMLQILLNAGRAVPENEGRIVISRSRDSDTDSMLLDFWNNGPPLPPDVHETIFRAGLSLWSGGSGLGLYMAREDARSMGAELSCVPERDGARFRLRLPLSLYTEHAPGTSPGGEEWQGSGDILLIDDEESNLKVLEMVLNQRGFRTFCAQSGKEGLELFARRAGDWGLALVDLRMPDMDGRDVIQSMREAAPSLPILLTSGIGPDGALMAHECGASDYLPKPFTAAQLVETIRRWCPEEFRPGARS